jgi:hypothetical protein
MKIDRRYTNVRNIARRAKFIVLNDAFFSHAMEKAHRLASRCGIEMRTPFYSRLFIEFAFATPERLRRRGSINKFIHLQACKDFLPPSLFQRTTKAELTSVLRPQLYCMKDDFTRKIPSELAEWVSPGGMAQLYQHYATSGSGSWELWGVYECASVFWTK